MCGIFGYVGTKTDGAAKTLAGLKQLEYRGYDSWGVAVAPDQQLRVEKHTGKIGEAELTTTAVPATLALGHTRWATHGGVTTANAHPHLSPDGQVAVVHNGIIENFQTLKEPLVSAGRRFQSETDTEVFVQLLDQELHRAALLPAVQAAFQQLTGLNALAVLSASERALVAVRLGSPLVIGRGPDGYYLASDAVAIAAYVDQLYYLEDGQVALLTARECQVFRLTDLAPQVISWQANSLTVQAISKGEFPHYLLKEIHEQPLVWHGLAAAEAQFRDYLTTPPTLHFLVGCGSAYHACLSGVYFLAQLAHQAAIAVPASECRHFAPLWDQRTAVSLVSQSGETIDVVEHLAAWQRQGLSVGAVVNRLGSTLERGTQRKVLLQAGPEQAVLATKSYTAMVASWYMIAAAQAQQLDQASTALQQLAGTVATILTPDYHQQQITPVAKWLSQAAHIFVIGRGPAYPAALEAALKIKEVTYRHTEGFAGGELKHGVIALVEEGTPCLVLAPSGDEYAATISNAIELRSRGAKIIGISDQPNPVFDHYLPIPAAGELAALALAVPVQLLAYEMAVQLGNDPDKPKNLAKSVTVK